MSRQSSSFELALPLIDKASPRWRWLYEALRQQMLNGQLKAGTRLPATRDLAKQYGLARGTVVSAFEQLKAEGYIEGHVGSGTYVNRTLPETLFEVGTSKSLREQKRRMQPAAVAHRSKRVTIFPGYEIRPTRAFRANLPALDLFPVELWTQVTSRVLRRAPTRALMGCDAMGYLPLRETIADHLITSRGVRCSADQIAVVSGIQEALDIASRLLLNAGDTVCMENPGYPGATAVFAASGAKIQSVPVDDEGIEVRRLPRTRVRLVYVTPGHQFPVGVTMSLARRLALIEWASKSGALIFEDDYDCEYRYEGRPVPALQGLDQHGVVLYAGTFSKTLFPALRLGYMVVPEALVGHVAALKSITSRHAPVLDQAVLHAFIAEGHFMRHIRRMRAVYAERLALFLAEAGAKLDGLLTMTGIQAGLQTAGWLPIGMNAEHVAEAAAQLGVEVTPLSRYADRGLARDGLQLGFAAINGREIRRGVEKLARAIEDSPSLHSA